MKRLLVGVLGLVLGVATAAHGGGAFGSRADFTLGRMFNAHGNFGFFRSPADPFTCTSNPEDQGSAYFNTTSAVTKICVGGTWTALGSGGGGGSGITSGTTVITGGTSTHVCFNDGGFMSCGDAGLTYDKTTDALSTGPLLSMAAAADLGSTTKPFRNLYLYGSGTYGTGYMKFAAPSIGAGQITINYPWGGGSGTFTPAFVDLAQTWTQSQTFTAGPIIASDTSISFGAAANTHPAIAWLTGQTPDTLAIATGTTSNHIVICERQDAGFDFGHAQTLNPTIFLQSASQSTTQYLGLAHNGTDAALTTGTGQFAFNAGLTVTGGVAGSTFTSTDHDTVRITSALAALRTGAYIRNSSSLGIQGVWVDNNRGLFASSGSLQVGATGSPTTLFGIAVPDYTYLFSGGASSAGLLVGTTTSDPFVLGTNDVARITVGASGSVALERTVTAAGTTGAQTINKMAGTVNFAAAATTLVVTNSQVSASSIVFCTRRTADTTCFLASCESGAGTLTIRTTAACAAETSFGFLVTN